MASPLRQQGAFDCRKPVIASQRARWRGNPFSLSMPEICTFYGDADCHTSDIGHWFAMTVLLFVCFYYGETAFCSTMERYRASPNGVTIAHQLGTRCQRRLAA